MMINKSLAAWLLIVTIHATAQTSAGFKTLAPGVYQTQRGVPDRFTPAALRAAQPLLPAMQELPAGSPAFNANDIKISITARGCIVEIPLGPNEHVYGFGLQMNAFDHKGLKKRPIANDNPLNDLGLTHAPVPMYISSAGYGILINTLRYTTFYCGTNRKKHTALQQAVADTLQKGQQSVASLYKKGEGSSGYVTVDIPGAKGIEVLVFNGPSMMDVIRRYNLFSGGGALPALWGLGVKYRVKADFKENDVYRIAGYFRQHNIPCDVIGLEPGWQSASYSCSYVWNPVNFKRPQQLTDSLRQQHYQLNLWEHAFIHRVSPLYPVLEKQSADYLVWEGLVPDFIDAAVRRKFAAYHDTALISRGISGFKLDECDNSNLTRGDKTWSFPECSQFPSGITGEQMHQTFGNLYCRSLYAIYEQQNRRTYFDIRSLGAFAAPFPAALYSDTYTHQEYIRMIPNAGFNGLLWSPEVRESKSVAELIRRTQTAVLAAQTVFNSWYLKNPPWLQTATDLNNKDSLLPQASAVEDIIRELLQFRMALAPYLYNAFALYAQKGIPPFRALVVDYPDDPHVYNISDEYMIGAGILAAPLADTDSSRTVYLPAGNWYDYNTHKKYAGNHTYAMYNAYNEIPVFIKEGTILPMARPLPYLGGQGFDITCYVFGEGPATGSLFEDDGLTNNFRKGRYNTILLSWNKGQPLIRHMHQGYADSLYRIKKWVSIK